MPTDCWPVGGGGPLTELLHTSPEMRELWAAVARESVAAEMVG